MTPGEHMSGTHDYGGDAAAYALGSLEPAEAEAFRRHLDECLVCRDEVEALEGVVQALPMAAPQYRVTPRLRRRVMRAIREEPREAVRPVRPRPSALMRARPRALAGALAAAAAVAAAVLGGVQLAGSGAPSRTIQAQVAGVSGSAQLRVSDGHGELVVQRLSPPPPGHVYEVWLKAEHAAPVPASVLFTVNSSGRAEVGVPGSLRGFSQVMVTAEPRGGSRAPTHSPVIVAQLT